MAGRTASCSRGWPKSISSRVPSWSWHSALVGPTKALCQDQLGTLEDMLFGQPRLQDAVRPAIYDGDTPTTNRRRIRSEANVVLTNPDMLHVGVLPYHGK